MANMARGQPPKLLIGQVRKQPIAPRRRPRSARPAACSPSSALWCSAATGWLGDRDPVGEAGLLLAEEVAMRADVGLLL
jgi:hypothetical protein